MNIYLNKFKHTRGNSSTQKSSGTLTPFYCIVVFIFLKFYAGMGFYISSYLYIDGILLYLCIRGLLSGISSILNIFILST